MSDDSTAIDVDELVAELRRRVEAREAAGEYPPGIDDRLEAHFDRIAGHRTPPTDFGGVRRRLADLDEAGSFSANRITTATRMPGGSHLHRTVAKVVGRQTEGILAQVQRHAEAVREAMWALLATVESPGAHVHADLLARLDTVLDRLAALERSQVPASAFEELAQRVAALEGQRRA